MHSHYFFENQLPERNMKMTITSTIVLAILSSAIASPTPNVKRAGEVQGFDISHYQSDVNFESAYDGDLRFV